MGIKGLNQFLKKKCPEIYREIHISDYAYKKVAIDLSLFLCKYKTICQERWITAFLNLVCCLRKYEVHAIFVYDTSAPPEKELEREERRKHKEKLESKWFMLNEALKEYYLTGNPSECLIDLYNKKKQPEPRRLISHIRPVNYINVDIVEEAITKIKGQILNISPEDYILTKQLFDILKVPYFQAPMEAETSCSDLCKRGLVDAALSEDSDILAYGSPIFLSKLDTTTGFCNEIRYEDVLSSLEISSDTFLDLCLMCGCDYNKNIPLIGPVKAYKLLKEHSSIEELKNITPTVDITILNHIRGRELFRNYEQINIEVPYCDIPDFHELAKFIAVNNIGLNIESLIKIFTPIIIFEED